mmetsp:Transcript_17660/g.44470  ORF Transcript_17660/g.44470 Transcript_17660/m.44470 type:complete len:629 (-) Transcript_17660:305-2191(-)
MSSAQLVDFASTLVSTGNRGNWAAYEWLVVVGGIVAFAMAWAIGANDVANSFGTTVGAKTITLWQACIIAAVFEFVGAVALGGEVAKTVAGSITSPSYFEDVPEVFAYGMLCAIISAWMWVTFATYMELAVSTTHSIIGAVLGFGLVFGGGGAIVWNQKIDEFPYTKGLVPVVVSWFASPIISSIVAAVLFLLNRTLVLRRQNSTLFAYFALPPLVFVTVYINIFFVLYKGAKNELHWDENKAGWVAAAVAGGATGLTIPCCFLLKWKADRDERIAAEKQAAQAEQGKDAEAGEAKAEEVEEAPKTGMSGLFSKVKKHMIYSMTVDVHEDVHKDEAVAAMHAGAEVFDPKTEHVYKYLQVFSACCVSFAHGANDVANAIGPFAGIWQTYRTYKVASEASTPKWILVLGGAGIVTGLATYGYNIIKVLGVKMAKMTPSRGYCAELATALTVSVASVYGLPISTTHCIVGAEVGVGAVEGVKHGTNWMLFAKTFSAWVFTLIVSAVISAAIFSYGVYAPSVTNLDTVILYEATFNAQVQAQMAQLSSTLTAMQALYNRTNLGPLSSATKNLNTQAKNLLNRKTYGQVNMYSQVELVQTANQLYNAYSIPVVGYNPATKANTTSQLTVNYP